MPGTGSYLNWQVMNIRFNVIVKLIGDDIMDKKIILKTCEGLLIGKSAVGAKNNRYFL